MANAKVSDYGIGDTNFDSLMLSVDAQRLGHMALSLSNFDNDSATVIESGSKIDVGGGLYKFTNDESISTTDPYTSTTVADGTVYIVLRKNMGTASGSTTDATGYAIGSTVFTLASAGTGSILAGDRIKFDGDDVSYEVTSGDADVSGGGSITIASPGIYSAIPSSATAITISSGSVLVYWTATAPVWRADYQGYYKTGTVDRYIGGCELSGTTTVFNSKYLYNGQGSFSGIDKTIIDVYASATGTGTEDPLIFNVKNIDIKSEYNTTSGVVTLVKGGYYEVKANIVFYLSGTSNMEVYIYQNSTVIAKSNFNLDTSNSIATLSPGKIIKCKSGDTLKVKIYTSSGSRSSGSSEVYFNVRAI